MKKRTRDEIAANPHSYACLDCRREVPIEEVEESGGHCGACGSTNLIPLGPPDSENEHGLL